MKNVLVTGGAGYIGSVLVRQLLEKKYNVRVMDLLNFSGESIVELFNYDNFSFIKGDTRDIKEIQKAISDDIEVVVHLAAIVGDPACAKNPELSRNTNFEATKDMYEFAEKSGVKQFIFASTCSNYGKMEDPSQLVTEESELLPVSLYAETKVASEKYLLSQEKGNNCKPTCLRFSTVYGLSPRMRFDLTVNEFTRDLALGRELIIFGEQFWRPYCHVVDLAGSIISVIESEINKVEFNVFNVGDTNENYQKQMIANEIVKQLPDSKIRYVEKNEDPRDYKVSFEKIKDILDFSITKTVRDGIEQIINIINNKVITDPDNGKYKNI